MEEDHDICPYDTGCWNNAEFVRVFLEIKSSADNEPEEPPVETWEKFYGAELDAWAYNEELEALKGPQTESSIILTSKQLSPTYRVSAQVIIGTAGQWGGIVVNYDKDTGKHFVLRVSPRKDGEGEVQPLQVQFLSFTGPQSGLQLLRQWQATGVGEDSVIDIVFERVFENDKWETRIKVGDQTFTDTNDLGTGTYAGYYYGGHNPNVKPMYFKAFTIEDL